MSAGTITLTNGSAIVGGSGTSFATELAAGDFIVSTVGGVPYTLPVKSVESNAQLTLVSSFTGPTQSDTAWSAVPRVALNMVTAALVAQSAEALRGLNYDKLNWQQVYSAAGNITVKLPDGTTFTGPSWKYLSDNMATKSGGAVPVNQGGTGSTTASGARTNLGLGDSATRNVGTAAGTVAAGDDSRFGTVNGKSGGTINGGTSINGDALYIDHSYGHTTMLETVKPGDQGAVYGGMKLKRPNSQGFIVAAYSTNDYEAEQILIGVNAPRGNPVWSFNVDGRAVGNWVNTSDARIKDNIKTIEDALDKMKLFRGLEWDRKDNNLHGYGFIAQEVKKVFPEAVKEYGETKLVNGEVVEKTLALDTSGVAAALHHEAILALMDKVEELKTQVDKLLLGQ
ncbi:tail fiber domain-containing protein [Enterobacter quasiroggenkampii]|uniref:tail fiber domain-containing protein n=1 Tax=Enterobacter quasiroggenkampii TaxID=2497436 RepID=UPI0021D25451|nr:tail fiber domain-containing protein [Enterobacter quasiroggenkampii]MCU6346007.1 tail fiber domain-containing protein [Enterobacter quasiroggenkampii]